jgi:Rod binding domain-containing protein
VTATPTTQSVATDKASAAGTARTQLREAAKKLIGEVFYGTLLKQYRSTGRKGTYGHGGRGEEVFQGQLDQVFAERAGAAVKGGLTDAIVQRFERRAAALAAYRAQSMNATEVKS